MNLEEMFYYLVDTGVATEDEIQLVCNINGWTEETMEEILYARTGYRSFKQVKEEWS